ncbi:1a92da63-964f-42c1-9ded-d29bf270bd70 [Thermothielavioides terrestris]|uniref:Methyltransferase-like protein n=2 Tax=Thermothielavioides terrestris TaxID=2587410 RepID=G2RD70_THETT|nr:uncharacterized protein THITE_2057389 [Thermothielavioides terrestris NRRL 8126]AEO69905.1 hypothetical protein THITE_2057389 [Thermothielavioides terrestris NRRL 8126]SPQ17700.1 1a92da63-964f-42c1-9ded-d29bf270bd70 [Thermothielavioides terrestris]
MTTTGEFFYLDPASISPTTKPWAKVDGGSTSSFRLTARQRSVTNLRDALPAATLPSGPLPGVFGGDIDVGGFAAFHAPLNSDTADLFTTDAAVRERYYPQVEALLRANLSGSSGAGKVARVVIFDHTIRRHDPAAPRQPVRQVHVDQTPAAAAARVRRHVKPAADAEALLQPGRRFQIINVWRPIGHAAADFPLAVVDWRSAKGEGDGGDLVPVDLLYPVRNRAEGDPDDDRGKEVPPDGGDGTEGYEVKGETYGVLPNEAHRFYYVKDMAPDEALFIKCFDSWSQGQPGGKKGVSGFTPHTAFVDPATPAGAKPRESIEVRCLVFYDE